MDSRIGVSIMLSLLLISACGRPSPSRPYTEQQILATAAAIQTRQALEDASPTMAPSTPIPTPRPNNGEVEIIVDMDADPTQWKQAHYPEYGNKATFAAAKAQWARWEQSWRAKYGTVPEWCTWVVTSSNLRAGLGIEYPIVGKAATGTCLELWAMNVDRTWYRTRDGQSWIFYQLVQNVPPELEIVEDPPLIRSTPGLESASSGCPGGCTTYPAWCAPPIKGNVSFNTGERIYHVPGSEWYDETNIDPTYGERWFCTEAEAQVAGWRRSYE